MHTESTYSECSYSLNQAIFSILSYKAQFFYEGIKENQDIPTLFSTKTKFPNGDIQQN